MSTDARRKTPRKALHGPAVIRLAGRSPLEVRTLDVGLDGLCVAAAVNVKSNLKCSVEFSLPVNTDGPVAFAVQARVVYSVLSHDSFKVGLHFMTPSPDALAALGRYLHG